MSDLPLLSCQLSKLMGILLLLLSNVCLCFSPFNTHIMFIEGKFCGRVMPKPVESGRNTMVVRFKSDNTLTSKGFRATFTKSSLPPVVVPTTTKPTTTARPTTETTPPSTSTSSGKRSDQTNYHVVFHLL